MKPIFMLPFDHRSGLARELFGKTYPVSPDIAKKIVALKKVIYKGFLLTMDDVAKYGEPAILVDEEFGADIIRDAQLKRIPVAVSVEKSGASSFAFVHGRGFGRQLAKLQPDYAKALVNYATGDDDLNKDKRAKLHDLSVFCEEERIPLLMEVLLHGKPSQLKKAQVMMREFHRDGIRPSIWKLEGLSTARDWKKLAKAAKAPIIVLGRGQSKADVERWVIAAARSGCADGFAIGRTIFLKPLEDLVAKRITSKLAAERIAANYLHFVKLWQKEAR